MSLSETLYSFFDFFLKSVGARECGASHDVDTSSNQGSFGNPETFPGFIHGDERGAKLNHDSSALLIEMDLILNFVFDLMK